MAKTTPSAPRVDPAGRPVEGRRRQALIALGIVGGWICLTLLIFWLTRGDGRTIAARAFVWLAIAAWVIGELAGGRHGPVWPTSALAVTASLSLGIGIVLSLPSMEHADFFAGFAIISGVASASMITWLFRFRLPGLVSPIITFAIITLFLAMVGVNSKSIAQVEGFSPRGILAALIGSPIWMAAFAVLSAGAMMLARRLDLHGDEFGLASARPLHIIGAGVLGLILGRIFGFAPPWAAVPLVVALWIAGLAWALRVNRFAVAGAIHLASTKPIVLGVIALTAASPDALWRPTFREWGWILTAIVVFDLLIWPHLHRLAMAHNYILGPGGRVPRPRDGWWWRYWPYA